jgi:hypothetical protein
VIRGGSKLKRAFVRRRGIRNGREEGEKVEDGVKRKK